MTAVWPEKATDNMYVVVCKGTDRTGGKHSTEETRNKQPATTQEIHHMSTTNKEYKQSFLMVSLSFPFRAFPSLPSLPTQPDPNRTSKQTSKQRSNWIARTGGNQGNAIHREHGNGREQGKTHVEPFLLMV